MVAESLIFGYEKVLPYAKLDMAHPRDSQQICLKVGKCSVCTILNASDAYWHYDTIIVLGGNSTGQLSFDKRLTGIFRGNRVVVQRIRKMELRSID